VQVPASLGRTVCQINFGRVLQISLTLTVAVDVDSTMKTPSCEWVSFVNGTVVNSSECIGVEKGDLIKSFKGDMQ